MYAQQELPRRGHILIDKMIDQQDLYETSRYLLDDPRICSISIDGTEVLNVTPKQTMWEYGGLDQDGNINNPWKAGTKMAPFDQKVSGYFPVLKSPTERITITIM